MQFFTNRVALLLALSGAVLGATPTSSGYADSCHNVDVYAPNTDTNGNKPYYELYGSCKGYGAFEPPTNLRLDYCLGNSKGRLTAQKGKTLEAGCRNFTLPGTVLFANCDNGKGNFTATSFDLNTIVGNQQGVLTCYGKTGA
ncbi:hypothetical protein B0A48_07798 [Cryoendolithus antarcticus]|uniref:Cyanovirin-N domain-containing protein n=1 Tax=Cryoendolithus antarcticus TaxID=1507870 RepID=A0A1V8T7M3_9PEZI|nr:hypothetical protein B0A48_07798 [Cryoendolithus antarcticus]